MRINGNFSTNKIAFTPEFFYISLLEILKPAENSSSCKQLTFKVMSSGKVLLGVLAGVAAGALIGILFAPDKGTTTRRKIVEKGEDYVDGIKDKFNGLIDDLNKKMDSAKAKVDDIPEEAKVV